MKRLLAAVVVALMLVPITSSGAASRRYFSKRTVVLAGDVTDSAGNNTYADCTGLSFDAVSGVRYWFSAHIWYTSAAQTTGSAWSINGPTTTDLSYTSSYTIAATTRTSNNAVAYDIPAAATATSIVAGNVALIEGTILPSASGTVVVRFMTEVDTSAIVCKAGSQLTFWHN